MLRNELAHAAPAGVTCASYITCLLRRRRPAAHLGPPARSLGGVKCWEFLASWRFLILAHVILAEVNYAIKIQNII